MKTAAELAFEKWAEPEGSAFWDDDRAAFVAGWIYCEAEAYRAGAEAQRESDARCAKLQRINGLVTVIRNNPLVVPR